MVQNLEYIKWNSIDLLLMGWLYSSMTPEIAMRVMGCSSNALWTAVEESYGIYTEQVKGYLWGNLVTWRSKKQPVVARSSAEAEFRALAHGICEIMWLKLLLDELGIRENNPMKVYCDNKAAIAMSHNPVHHDRTKHVEVDRHFIKEKIENGTICMTYIPSSEQLADLLTKGLFKPIFEKMVDKLGLFNLYSPA